MLKWQKWPKWLKWHCETLNVHNFANNRDIEVGFSLFDFYGSKLSVKMVYDGFGSFGVFSYFFFFFCFFWSIFQQQLSLASINGVVCHCLRVIWAPSTWSPRLHPITVLSLHLKGPRALTWFLPPPPHSPPLKPVQTIHRSLCSHQTSHPGSPDVEFTGRGVFQVLNTSWHS